MMTNYEVNIRRLPDKKTRVIVIHSSYSLDKVYELVKKLIGIKELKG